MSRSTHARAILGDELYGKLSSAKTLVVGAGGIGCELLKNLVLSGFGEITLLDLDTIDLSNLNRQFLFRKKDVKQSKALVAAATAQPFNPSVKIYPIHGNIKEPQFDVGWFKQFDIVMNALDNLDARRHVNKMCIAAGIPLIESGTAGYLGISSCLPLRPWADKDNADRSGPAIDASCSPFSLGNRMFRLQKVKKSQWFEARQLFGEEEDEGELDRAVAAGENASEIATLKEEAQAFKTVRSLLRTPADTTDKAASAAFAKIYDQDIRRLLAMSDMWKYRVPPVPLDRSAILEGVFVDSRNEATSGKEDGPNAVREKEGPNNGGDNSAGAPAGAGLKDQKTLTLKETVELFDDSLRRLAARIPKEEIITFDKDDDDTLDFVTAGANLRAYAYGIEQKTRWEVKETAGNIIPAIATTNAIIAGLIVIQALNVLKSVLPNASAQTGGALANSAPKNVLIQTKPRAPLGVQNLCTPNPHCAVCRPVYVIVQCDTTKITLGDIVKGVLEVENPEEPREVSVFEAGRILAEPDWDDNFERTLDSLNCGRGAIIMIADDAEEVVDLAVCLDGLPESHPSDSKPLILPSVIPPLPKRAPKPKEPTPEPPVATGSKRRVPDDEDEIQVIEPGAQNEAKDGSNRTSGPNATKRTPDDTSGLERTAKRLRLASSEAEEAMVDDDDEITILE
ncbi:Uba2 [Rhizoctonia solani]|uniref:Ubiquitin-activating enzyme E1-like n=1 Tax=Rhizoctonia solani TaxID=456999 RepID=A0A8H8SWI5_9AGAM|nr:Uba2 [Rhizoctonia solani]QRW21041.1 Uba2 [Rhizoctonia solani]